MSKHLLLYTDDPGLGGVGQYNHSILCELIVLGYRVTCVQTRSSNPLVERQNKLGIQHIWLEFDTAKGFGRTLTDPSDAQRILTSAKPDLIIFSDSCPMSNFAAKQVAIQLGIPYIVVVGFVAPYLAERFTTYLNELSHHYAQAKAVIAVSTENLSLLHKLFRLQKDKGQVIYYGRPEQYFNSDALSVRERLRQEFAIPSDAIVCFTAARLEAVKGYQYQLEAIKQLKQSPIWPQLYFVWAGPGTLEPQLKEQVKQLGVANQVKILGQRWDIADWLDASDIFVLPSELEGMPLAIMEAMAKGLPVIASAVSGIPEELGDTGKLLPSPAIEPQATIRELVTVIQDWSVSPDLRYSVGWACKTRAVEMFREERMVKEAVEVIEHALLPVGDYVSPGLSIVRPDKCFTNMIVGDMSACPWPYLRREIPHNWYVDKRQPTVGFLSRDEAHILYNTALKFKGKRALEIGCWLGWSACHLALAGVGLDVIDPLLARPEFYESVSSSLKAAGVLDSVNLVAGYSPQTVEELAAQFQRKWSLIFIDGNHDAPGPLNDAIACEQLAETDALILFHDLAAPDVAQGLECLKQRGWNTMVYQTMQIMGVAWRGNVEPVHHQPDSSINWRLPVHLQHCPVSGTVKQESNVSEKVQLLSQSDGFIDQLLQCIEQSAASNLQPITLDLKNYKQQLAEWLRQGKEFYVKSQAEQAIAVFSRILDLNPGSAISHNALSNLYWQQGEVQKSIQYQILAGSSHQIIASDRLEEFQAIWNRIRPYTLLEGKQLLSLYSLAKQVCLDDIPGNFVECGSYKGGSAALLAYVIKHYSLRPRILFCFDTFEGMPEPVEIDRLEGIPANETPWGGGMLQAPLAGNLEVICQTVGVRDIVRPVPGLFAHTLPQQKSKIGEIAFLYADADWYESTLDIFNNLYDSVVTNGTIQVDDYLTWEGCTQAVNEFQRQRNTSFAIRVIDDNAVWFRKGDSINQDCNHRQIFWHIAQTAEKTGNMKLAERAGLAVLKITPRLLKAEHLNDRIKQKSISKVKLRDYPLISVVIPCYNQAQYLPEAVNSVIAQTYENWEIIIVNDGSPDNTSEAARQLIETYSNYQIRLIEKENGGLGSARNAGIEVAHGEYIMPLDADNKLVPTALTCLLNLCLRQDKPCVAFGSYKMFGVRHETIVSADLYSAENLKQFNMFHPSSLYPKNTWQLVDGYKEGTIDGYEDWEFWVNCHANNIPFVGTRDVVIHYRKLPGAMATKALAKHDQLHARIIYYNPEFFGTEALKKAEIVLQTFESLSLLGVFSIKQLEKVIEKYQQDYSNPVQIKQLSQMRSWIAEQWLKPQSDQLANLYSSTLGQLHRLVSNCGIKYQSLTRAEQDFVNQVTDQIFKGLDQDQNISYLLAAMLYLRADQLPLQYDLLNIPAWFLSNYLKFLFSSPQLFQRIGEVDDYYCYLQRLLDYLHTNIFNNQDSKPWQDVALSFTQNANFIPLYFSSANLRDVYEKRADIMEFALRTQGHQVDYEFPERSPEPKKIRLGILATHFQASTETFHTLPAYKQLDWNVFEVILYTINSNNNRIEHYCAGHADALVVLPPDLATQVQTIREGELDILLVATNITAVTNSITLLALHRLARVQVTFGSSPVTTGMRNIDYFISGSLSENPVSGQEHYREKLVLLDGVGYCFDYPPALATPTIKPKRKSWGTTEKSIVFTSGANFYKVIPELRETWAKILAAVPNSILVLYPFAPSWSNSYPAKPFFNQMYDVLAKYGIDKNRLVVLETLPNRGDVKECLKLADVYLDSYWHSGGHSLIDALDVSLPTVVMEGNPLRSRHASAYLRDIQMPELIADNEEAYIELAIALGTNPELRKQKSDQIKQRMQANPRFLDSRAYSAQMGALFQELFQKHQAAALKDNLKLRDTNLIIFPDWNQSEDLLLQDLASVVRAVVTHPNKDQMTLLIDTSDVSEENANLALSTVVMNLLMEEDLDVTDGPEISLTGRLSEVQWQALLPHIQARIALENENQQAILYKRLPVGAAFLQDLSGGDRNYASI